ncbi:uncharacterized protein K452DRAFT_314974 [Aplosporella prunicola CBS 121167]|uniref:Uncharacterized protein n=1 Tax=Aplosporella prunicola CBS 121167 TaxID=1176127 RepID=A0A6A6BU01_9PEZI|nr:uncharacterized protein K452DRAFT_314974 [Aplosporella prunicola CBS 121167]KAF2146745.1 hypothetical protein K452DRAFT_314974 [Aplosporella prunicola CBS 121167]
MKSLPTIALYLAAISTTVFGREKKDERSDPQVPAFLSGFFNDVQDTARVAINKADKFIQDNNIAEEAQNVASAVFSKGDDFFQTKVIASLPPDVQTFFQQKTSDLRVTVVAVKWEYLAEDAKQYIREHPYQTALLVTEGVVYFTPAGLSGGVLNLLGWTRYGPRAASFASKLQAALGPVYARSIRATAQSAAMGGYGASVIHGVTRAGAALSGALTGTWNKWQPSEPEKENNKGEWRKEEL